MEHSSDYNEYDDDDDDYEDDDEHNRSLSEASKCQFDILTIEEYDNDGSLIQSKKHCEIMPKKMNTTNVVTVKFVYLIKIQISSIFTKIQVWLNTKI